MVECLVRRCERGIMIARAPLEFGEAEVHPGDLKMMQTVIPVRKGARKQADGILNDRDGVFGKPSVRKIFGSFPIEQSEWLPYWDNSVQSTHEKVKISYYRYTDLTGAPQILAFAVNISASPVD